MIVSDNEVGDIFDSPTSVRVIPVNTVGAMGAGLALQAKLRVPELYKAYRQACYDRVFSKQGFFVYHDFDQQEECITYVCIPTKRDWRHPSILSWVEIAVRAFCLNYWRHDINPVSTIAIPALGCGLGELDWKDIKPILVEYFGKVPLRAYLYPPQSDRFPIKKKERHTPS